MSVHTRAETAGVQNGARPSKAFIRRRLRSLEEAALNMGMSKSDAEYYAGAALKIEIDSAFPATVTVGSSAKPDGRNRRAANTRAAILAACRTMMVHGIYRPPMKTICSNASVSIRSGFQHFGSIEDLWREAIAHAGTFDVLAGHIFGSHLASMMGAYVVKRAVWAAVLHERHTGH